MIDYEYLMIPFQLSRAIYSLSSRRRAAFPRPLQISLDYLPSSLLIIAAVKCRVVALFMRPALYANIKFGR